MELIEGQSLNCFVTDINVDGTGVTIFFSSDGVAGDAYLPYIHRCFAAAYAPLMAAGVNKVQVTIGIEKIETIMGTNDPKLVTPFKLGQLFIDRVKYTF